MRHCSLQCSAAWVCRTASHCILSEAAVCKKAHASLSPLRLAAFVSETLHRVVQALLDLVDRHAHGFKLVDIHMTVWGCAKLQRQLPDNLLHLLASRALHR